MKPEPKLFKLRRQTARKNLEGARRRRDELAAKLIEDGRQANVVEQLCANPFHLGATVTLLGFIPNPHVPASRTQTVATEIAFLTIAREVAKLEREATAPAPATQLEMETTS